MEPDLFKRLGRGWIALSLALGVHVFDEAANDFLSWYNPIVRQIRDTVPWLPLPTFTFGVWLAGLIAGILLLLAVSPKAFQGRRWIRWASYPFAAIMCGNGAIHILGSIAWRRFLPGVYSAPLLIAASICLWRAARMNRPAATRFAQA